MIFTPGLREDYRFVKRVIEHTDNRLVHYPAIQNLIASFERKWKYKKHKNETSAYNFSVHSLNLYFKKSIR
jgi:hypothetical protein